MANLDDVASRDAFSTAISSSPRPILTHRNRTTGHIDARSPEVFNDAESDNAFQEQSPEASSSTSSSSVSAPTRMRGVSLGTAALRPRSWGRSSSYAPSTERVSSYLEALDLHLLPASVTMSLASLRDALLAYLGEAEAVIEGQARAVGETDDGEAVEDESEGATIRSSSPEYTTEQSSSEPEQLPATESPVIGGPDFSTPTSSGYTSMLRQRGHALRRRLSGTLAPSALLGPLPSSEALLAQLSAIREDVMASLPAVPTLPSVSGTLPRTPSLSSLTASGHLDAAAAILPGFLQRLPARLQALNEHINRTTSSGDSSVESDQLPSAVRLSPANQERAIQLIRSLLPSDQWAGWEQLGWDDQSSAWRGAGNDEDDEDGERDSQGLFRKGSEEEPEYFFPFKTPRAAMSRQASWVAAKQRRERSRSLSMSATVASPEKRHRSKSSVGDGTSVAGLEGEAVGLDGVNTKPTSLEVEIDQFESEIEESTVLLPIENAGPTVQEALEKSKNGRALIAYDDIPFWMQVRPPHAETPTSLILPEIPILFRTMNIS